MEEGIINTLRELAYTYYPYSIYDGDVTYDKSPQNMYLKTTKSNQAKILLAKWELLVKDISDQSSFYNIYVQDWRETLPVDHCFKLVIISHENREDITNCIRLVLNLSLLIPYFVIHQSIYTPDSKKLHYGNYSSVSFNIPNEANTIYDSILKVLKKYFPNYSIMGEEILETPIEGIFYASVGNLPNSQLIGKPMNIFNAFFSLNYL